MEWVLLKCTSTVPVTLIIRYRDFVIFISHNDAFCFFVKTYLPLYQMCLMLSFLQLGFASMPKRGRGGTLPGQRLVSQHQDQEDIPPSCGPSLPVR